MGTLWYSQCAPIRLGVLLLFAVLHNVALSYQRHKVVIGQVAQRDTSRPVYEIHLPPLGEYQSIHNPSDLPIAVTPMRMVTARGQVMNCMVPEPEPVHQTRPPGSEEGRFDDIDELLKEYENKCFWRQDHWWTYEFCYGKHVIQKHIIPKDRVPHEGEVEDEFVLGRFDRALDMTRRRNASEVSLPDAAFTQLFTNGTICDKTNQPRQAIIKYLCQNDAVQLRGSSGKADPNLNIINSINEKQSCVYEVEFINSAICRHSTYKEMLARTARPIHCSLEQGERPFEGLLSNTYQKASLNL